MSLILGDTWLKPSPTRQNFTDSDSVDRIPETGHSECTRRPPPDCLDRFDKLLEVVGFGLAWHREIADRMRLSGLHPALIYAYWHTGFLLRDGTVSRATTQELVNWNVAIDGWERERRVIAPERRWFSDEEYWSVATCTKTSI